MDFTTPLIFLVIFVCALLSLFLVYKFGIKEKSYEEALAEQRQHTNALLGVKPKPKEKKSKKAAKKSKEKPVSSAGTTETETNDESDNIKDSSDNTKPHVEFKEETEEVAEDIPVKEIAPNKKRIKKVRSILVKKDKSPGRVVISLDTETPTANHFEEIHPKDEFELLRSRSNSREDLGKVPVKEKPNKKSKQQEKAVPAETSIVTEKEKDKEEKPVEQPKITKKSKHHQQQQEKIIEPPVIVEKEEKPVEVVKPNKKSKQQQQQEKIALIETSIITEKEKDKEERITEISITPSVNENVVNAGKEKKKKKSEFNSRQQLTAERDQLINSVRKAELSRSEVQMLIDLLLNKQLEAPAVIDEWSEGKSDPVQKLKKQLAEKEKLLVEEQEALLGAQAKLKEVRTEQLAERTQLQQKIRGLEEVLQGKQLEIQTVNNRLQVNTQKMQQLQAQINEEILKAHKIIEDNNALQMQRQQLEVRLVQVQETEGLLVKLRSDNEELLRQNQHFGVELQRLSQENTADKEHQQHYIIQLNNKQKELEQVTERSRQLEDSHQELERKLDITLRQENDWKIEISKLNTALQQQFEDKRRMELSMDQQQEEIHLLTNEKAENLKIISQLKMEIDRMNEEKLSQLNGSSEKSKAREVEVLNLTNELTSAKNELSTAKTEIQKVESKYKNELEETGSKYRKLQSELEEQKEKNNKLTTEIRNKEQDAQKQFILRLFPEIDSLKAVSSDDWQAEFGRLIKNYVNDLKKKEKQPTPPSSPEHDKDVIQLQIQIQHYKKIIDDTEGILTKLQLHIEREERDWRSQLAAKELEIENLKESYLLQLQTKVVGLENQLSLEQSEKNRLLEECQLLRNKPEINSVHLDATATIEKLSEEVNRLREQLNVEQTKNGDVNVCQKAQNFNSNSTNGPALIEGNGN